MVAMPKWRPPSGSHSKGCHWVGGARCLRPDLPPALHEHALLAGVSYIGVRVALSPTHVVLSLICAHRQQIADKPVQQRSGSSTAEATQEVRLRAVQCYKYLHHVQPLTVMSRKGETMSAKWRASQSRAGLCGGPLDRSVQVLMLALLMYLHSRRQSHCSEPCRELLLCCQHSYKHKDIVCILYQLIH